MSVFIVGTVVPSQKLHCMDVISHLCGSPIHYMQISCLKRLRTPKASSGNPRAAGLESNCDFQSGIKVMRTERDGQLRVKKRKPKSWKLAMSISLALQREGPSTLSSLFFLHFFFFKVLKYSQFTI